MPCGEPTYSVDRVNMEPRRKSGRRHTIRSLVIHTLRSSYQVVSRVAEFADSRLRRVKGPLEGVVIQYKLRRWSTGSLVVIELDHPIHRVVVCGVSTVIAPCNDDLAMLLFDVVGNRVVDATIRWAI